MKCPVCKETALVMSERQSIEIDYCPDCRGVWLDRGELDKLIEKSITQNNKPSQVQHTQQASSHQHSSHQSHSQHQNYQQPYPSKKRESWLSELFD